MIMQMVLIGSDYPTYGEISTISDNFDMDGENDIGISELNEVCAVKTI